MTRSLFGKRLREIRKQKGLDQLGLALQAGYENGSAISKIEKGQVDVPLSSIIALATALEVPIAVLFSEHTAAPMNISMQFLKGIEQRAQSMADDLHTALLIYD